MGINSPHKESKEVMCLLYFFIFRAGTLMNKILCKFLEHEFGKSDLKAVICEQKMKKNLSNITKEKIESGEYAENKDISFVLEIMRIICKDTYDSIPKDLNDEFNTLRQFRNDLFHLSDINIDHEECSRKINYLKENLLNICKLLKKNFIWTFPEEEEMIEKMDVEYNSGGFRLEKSHQQQIDDLLRCLHNVLINQGCKELKCIYKEIKITNPCDWLSRGKSSSVPIDTLYTPLEVEHSEKKIHIEDILLQDSDDKVPPVRILKGLAGSGKTTLCHYILHEWCKDSSIIKNLNSFDLVLYIEIGKIRERSFGKYMAEVMLRKTAQGYNHDDVRCVLNEFNLLFIIDGFDEKNENSENFVKDLVGYFNQSQFILCTRPEYVREAVIIFSRARLKHIFMNVKGFDEVGLHQFCKKSFSVLCSSENKAQKEYEDFTSYLRNRGAVLQLHLNLPLTCALLVMLWTSSDEGPQKVSKISSASSLYHEIFSLLVQHLAFRLHSRAMFSRFNITDLVELINKLLLKLGEIAFHQIEDGNILMRMKNIDILERFFREQLNDVYHVNWDKEFFLEFMSAFMMVDVEVFKDKYLENKVGFLHRTQMEYFAGYFASEKYEENQSIFDGKDLKKYNQALKYFIGSLYLSRRLGNAALERIFGLLHKEHFIVRNYNYLYDLLIECPITEQGACYGYHDNIRKSVEICLPENEWQLCADDVSSGLRLLSYTKLKNVSHIEIYIDRKAPDDIPEFYNTMLNMKHYLYGRYYTKKPIIINLLFQKQFDFGNDTADKFLRCLPPWGHLREFKGHLGTSAEEVLDKCFKLRNIYVRFTDLEALLLFQKSFKKFYKSVKKLSLVLEVTKLSDLKDLSSFSFNGNFDMTLRNVGDSEVSEDNLVKEISWTVSVVKCIAPCHGVGNLRLERIDLPFKFLRKLIRDLLKNVCRIQKIWIKMSVILASEEMSKIASESDAIIEWI